MISGLSERWKDLKAVRLGTSAGPGDLFRVEGSRAYRDRLVLKLEGVDDSTTAGSLRGLVAWAPGEEVPRLPEGEFYQQRLLGLEVIEDRDGRRLGRIEDVIETGEVDVLVVRGHGREVLVPLAREFLVLVDEAAGRVRVRLPEGLEEIYRAEGEAAT